MSDGDGYGPYQWQVGDPEDWGDSVGVPDIPYMGYLNGDDDDDDCMAPREISESEMLHDEAWALRCDGRYEEALDKINRALELDSDDFDNWNVKAIILEDMHDYEMAIDYYTIALKHNPSSEVVKNNKAYSLSRIAEMNERKGENLKSALTRINEALSLVSNDSRRNEYLRIKGKILERMGNVPDAWACYLLASGMEEEVREMERQRKIIESSTDILINITGTSFYGDAGPLVKGNVVELIAEPSNIHDSDAIRVERNGITAGYVANSDNTLIDGVKSATDLKGKIKTNQRAEVMFRYARDYIIARLMGI
ncbi:hypothetical protein [uncultured Methanobrevibacter sp.]|uniref:hypothetical protein n=1 Tax=uncultured Methanobrevibacter sp. TaxID=253161 RepID=UPI00260DB9C9|nr:hypothetical protein [uncultured Methanobrevibacter sp.]